MNTSVTDRSTGQVRNLLIYIGKYNNRRRVLRKLLICMVLIEV